MKELRITPKLWGEEHLLVNEPQYAIKLLFIKKGSTSKHYHVLKKETLYVLNGTATLRIFTVQEKDETTHDYVLQEGDYFTVMPCAIHQITGPATILEVSTQPYDDVIRL